MYMYEQMMESREHSEAHVCVREGKIECVYVYVWCAYSTRFRKITPYHMSVCVRVKYIHMIYLCVRLNVYVCTCVCVRVGSTPFTCNMLSRACNRVHLHTSQVLFLSNNVKEMNVGTCIYILRACSTRATKSEVHKYSHAYMHTYRGHAQPERPSQKRARDAGYQRQAEGRGLPWGDLSTV
jgi:hypothetical protein